MHLQFWLANFGQRLSKSVFSSNRKRRPLRSDLKPALVESLESRKLLSAVAVGVETQINTATVNDQTSAAIARDAVGDYVSVWQSSGQDGSLGGIYAQRFNGSGVASGSEFRVNSFTTGDQINPAVAADASGDFVVTWQGNGSGDSTGIFAQRFNALGVAQGSEFRVNTVTTGQQADPTVAMDATGNFVIAWDSTAQAGASATIEAQRYTSAGVVEDAQFRVNTTTTGSQSNPTIAENASGSFVIGWTSAGQAGTGQGIEGQLYSSTGAAINSQLQINTTTTSILSTPKLAIDGSGEFVATWASATQDGSGSGVYAQRFDNTAAKVGTEFKVNTFTTGDQINPVVAMDRLGAFAIAWDSVGQDGDQGGIYVQQYTSTGAAVGGEVKVETTTTGNQSLPSIATDAMGDFVVQWSSNTQDGSGQGVFAQRFQADVAPLLSAIESSTLTAPSSQQTQITGTLAAGDQDSQLLASATVKISNNYQNGQDQLNFTNTAKIHGSWDAATGTLTLTGVDTVSNYRAALRSVTYHNTSGSPNLALTRTVTFQVSDGVLLSNSVSRDISVTASTAPILSGVTGTIQYIENAAPLQPGGHLVITDGIGGTLASATVTFQNWQAEDRANFNNIFALQHSFSQDLSAHTATLTITGNDTIDHYQTLLRSVVYWDVSDNPITTARTASFQVNDGGLTSNVVTRSISITPVNDAPVISGISSVSVSYKANDPAFPPQVISSTLVVADPDTTTLSKATVQITGGYQNNSSGHDLLHFANQNGITGSFNAATGTLTLSGTSSVSNYTQALRSVTFSTSGSATSTATRTLTITATDTAAVAATSIAATVNVNVSITNNPPALTGLSATPLTYVRGSAGIKLAPNILALDNDSINFTGATIKITGNDHPATDVLGFTAAFGVTGSFNASTGTLTLNGTTSIANYQTLLRSVVFGTTTTTANKLTRTVSFSVNDGLAVSSPISTTIQLT